MCKTKHSSKGCNRCLSSLLPKYTFSDLVGQRPGSLIIIFEQVIKAVLV